ncbi:MAG: hypothetical protein Q8M12_04215, partial [bacterium]|nr:hypothetical protein [bacterium]
KTCLNIPATIGSCGTADGQSFADEPSDNLCASGNSSSITGTWDWTCNGICSTTNESCHASQSLDLNWKEVNPN